MSQGRELAVGVDIGTTETKALVIDTADGTRVGFARRPTRWTSAAGGRVETSADAFVSGVLDAVGAALAEATAQASGPSAGPLRVSGIGLTGLAESGVVVDRDGRARTPVIAWYDQRGAEEIAELAAREPEFAADFPGRVGLPLDAQCTLAKLLWLRGTGTVFPDGAQWLNIPEYVAHTLGAERMTEPSLAARTGLVDAAIGQPWPAAVDHLGVGAGFLPPALPAGHSAGQVSLPDAPPALRGAAVTVAGHDHPVAAVGAGVTAPNMLFNSTGTADVLLRSVPRPLTEAERAELVAAGYSAGAHVLPGHTALIGSVRAGLVLGRVLDLLGRSDLAARLELDQRWRPDAAPSGVTVTGARQTDSGVTIQITEGASPDAAWAAALAHISEVTSALLGSAERIVGGHQDALAAGGWVRLASVRASKSQTIPRLRFADIDQPGALGAALFAAWAGAGHPEPFGKFTDPLRPAGSPARPALAPPSTHATTHASTPTKEATTW